MTFPYDICIITAANEQQARGYKMQLEWRLKKGLLSKTEFRIIADPNGARIGSGGSTFYSLAMLHKEFGDAIVQKRILILHSGGDSKRLPAYSIVGKLFAPLPSEKHHALFDVMLENYSQLPSQERGQLVVVSGDVLLNFDPAFVDFSENGITGVAYPDSPERGRDFGVYVVRNPKKNATPADDVLQKPDVKTLTENDVIDFTDRIWIDTGILNFAADAVEALLKCYDLIADAEQGRSNLNLYHEILYAVAGKMDISNSDILSTIPLFTNCLPYCGFYHVGRSRELLQSFYSLTHAAMQYNFENGTRSNVSPNGIREEAWTFNAIIRNAVVEVKKPCLIEGCVLDGKVTLDGQNILTNIPGVATPIHLQKGVCLNVVPLVNGTWAAIIYGIEDQFKAPDATFLNQPIDNFLQTSALLQADVWREEAECGDPWTARFFPTADDPEAAIQFALTLQSSFNADSFKKMDRMSMSDILQSADYERILLKNSEIERLLNIYSAARYSELDPAFFSTIDTLAQTDIERKSILSQLQERVNAVEDDPVAAAKLHHAIGRLYENNSKSHFDRAFSAIRKGVALGLQGTAASMQEPRLAVQSDQVTWVMLPARFDFAGGWTDTPPICLERGGCVLNASVVLNGQYPIQVIGKVLPDVYEIGINSIDLAQRETIKTMDELHNFQNPADWLSLPKAAFFAAGIFDEENRSDLKAALKKLGGGIDLTLFSALPSGSGLGTSSILGAGIIAALARMVGVDMPRQELYARTSYMEQLMTTGGGWQDHIGGVAGGVKLITSSPGYDQTPTLSWTHLKQPGMALNEHFLLYYTGIRRLAKNLLRQVVGRFLEQQPGALHVLDEMADLARCMKEDLDHRRFEEFGRNIDRSWELNKALDRGQTTDDIEDILSRIDDFTLGAKLLGAGGGGFLFIAGKDREAVGRIRTELTNHAPNERARFFDFDIDLDGMRVTVL